MKDNFTDKEWSNLINVPYAVAMTVSVAAVTLFGQGSETKTMITEPARLAAASGSALVGLVSDEIQSNYKNLIGEQQDFFRDDKTGYRNRTIEACKSAAIALSKVSPDEAMAYKKWVFLIGQKVAEAAKEEGSFVSEPEREALNEIAAALGISA